MDTRSFDAIACSWSSTWKHHKSKTSSKNWPSSYPPEQLDTRAAFEPVKCLFSLSRLSPEDAEKEVTKLLSLQGSVISLPSTGQIQVIDNAGVMRVVREWVRRSEDPESMRGSSIMAIPLKHITANEVLDVARPLLSLPEGVNSSPDISLSTDTFATRCSSMPRNLKMFRNCATWSSIWIPRPAKAKHRASVAKLPNTRCTRSKVPIQS